MDSEELLLEMIQKVDANVSIIAVKLDGLIEREAERKGAEKATRRITVALATLASIIISVAAACVR